MKPYILVVVAAAILALLLTTIQKRALWGSLTSAVLGLTSLAFLQVMGFLGSVVLSLNGFTFAVALFLGVPGVIGLLVLRVISIL